MRTALRKSHGKITFVLYNKPHSCGGHCLYCFSVQGLTKSTTSNEDTELARICGWSGEVQISQRFLQYGLVRGIGNKCDLAVKGDSFASHDPDYLRQYMKEVYDFLNGTSSSSLKEAARLQRLGSDRCVTLKVETRPDHIDLTTCNLLVELGVTTVELGVQSLNDNILEINKRGHNVQAVINATRLLRTYGFEVCYQIMVGLPGSNRNEDGYILSDKLWQDEFGPDALKIYPCILLKKNAAHQKRLYELYLKGLWRPMGVKEYISLLNECYRYIPKYVHINRIQRIIPQEQIEAGPADEINRQIFSSTSKCLWQRSVAQNNIDLEGDFRNYKVIDYPQGGNRYCFEAVFADDIVLGYGRLDIFPRKALIRDIRVLGNMLPVGMKNNFKRGCQHIGIGTSIINAMEYKAKKENVKHIYVKPSFGSMVWFAKFGYCNIGNYYLCKKIIPHE